MLVFKESDLSRMPRSVFPSLAMVVAIVASSSVQSCCTCAGRNFVLPWKCWLCFQLACHEYVFHNYVLLTLQLQFRMTLCVFICIYLCIYTGIYVSAFMRGALRRMNTHFENKDLLWCDS